MADYETGFYVDGGYYGGQQFIGADIGEALEAIESDYSTERMVYDYICADWDYRDMTDLAHDVVYEGLLGMSMDDLAEAALGCLTENTTGSEGPVLGNVYWWERGFSDAPRPPPHLWGHIVSGSTNRKPKATAKKASKPKAALKVSRNARPKVKAPARKTTARKPAAKKANTRRY